MQNILHTIDTLLVGNREISTWSDGHLEIEDPGRNFQETPTLAHICMDPRQTLMVGDFINEHRAFLEQFLEQ